MTKFLVGSISDLKDGQLTNITAGGKEIVVGNVAGNYFAMDNVCSHAGAELHEGELDGKELKCPWHGAKWDITTGNLIWFPQDLKKLTSYKTVVEDNMLYIET